MKKRGRLLLIASLPLAVAVVFGALAMLPAPLGVTKANFDRIENGMTKPEIECIIGLPTDQSAHGLNWLNAHNYKNSKAFMGAGQDLVVWGGDDGVIIIVFAADGSIVRKGWLRGSGTNIGRFCDWCRHFFPL
jgi:hypothetical protein